MMERYKKIMYISYNKERSFVLTLLVETKRGVIPYTSTINELGDYYPYVAEKLKNGMIVYKNFNLGYLGTELYEGPYGEEKVFIVEYETTNNDLNELLFSLNEKIKNNKKVDRKLIKIGNSYE